MKINATTNPPKIVSLQDNTNNNHEYEEFQQDNPLNL